MIDSKDLMLGNWVKSPQGITQVHNVLTDKIITKNDKKGVYFYHTTDIEPIPVTKEILKKIGFKKDTTAGEPWEFWRYWDKDGKYKLDVYPEELYCNSNRKFGLHVDNASCNTIGSGEFDYVHELQNLVRINCKADLPITKNMIEDV